MELILFFLYLGAVMWLASWLGIKYYRPYMQRREQARRKAQLERAVTKHQTDEELIQEILRERGLR